MEGSGSVQIQITAPEADPGGPKTYPCRCRSGTLLETHQATPRVIRAFMWSGLRCAFPRDLVEKVVIQPDGPHSVQSVERSSSDAEQQKHNYGETKFFYQCCGSGMFIPDPKFFHPGSASVNLSILTKKKDSKLSEIWSGLFIPPGYRSRFLPNPDPGSRGQKGTGSRIRIRNTVFYNKKNVKNRL